MAIGPLKGSIESSYETVPDKLFNIVGTDLSHMLHEKRAYTIVVRGCSKELYQEKGDRFTSILTF